MQPANYAAAMTIDLTGRAGYIAAMGYEGMFPGNPKSGTAMAPSKGATPESLTVKDDLSGTEGLGVANSHQRGIAGQDVGFIAPTDAVVVGRPRLCRFVPAPTSLYWLRSRSPCH
jgi:hypothetical protein